MAVSRTEHPCVPRQVTITDALGLLPSPLNLRTAVTVLAGLNGVGKTRLLRLLQDSLDDHAQLIELHTLCSFLEQLFEERSDLKEATEEAASLQVDTDTLDAVRRIVGRDYDSILWYALEFAESPFEDIAHEAVLPYFVVTEGTVQYDSSEMGLGELAAHVLLWTLWYLRNDDEAIVLLDEPDAYFPPSSREPLLDYIGSIALERKQAFVITTHSRELIERSLMHDEVLTYIGRSGEKVGFVTDRAEVGEVVEGVLYPEAALQLLAWVEDDAAYALALGLLKRLDRALFRRTALYWTTGSGDLVSLRNHMRRPAKKVRPLEFLFLWDGDEKDLQENESLWPGALLPGGESPDALFKRHAVHAVASIQTGLGVSPAALDATLEKVAGVDPHDWTAALVESSGIERSGALRVIADATIGAQPALIDEFRQSLLATGLDAVAPLGE